MPSNETTFEVEEGEVRRIPDRNSLMRAQTPQGFRLHRIISGYKQLKNDESFALTDDCGVIAKYFPDTPIGIIHGSIPRKKHKGLPFLKIFSLRKPC